MRLRTPLHAAALLLTLLGPVRAAEPTFEQLISLRRVSSPAVSADGRAVAFVVREADWDANVFVSQVWLADVARRLSALS